MPLHILGEPFCYLYLSRTLLDMCTYYIHTELRICDCCSGTVKGAVPLPREHRGSTGAQQESRGSGSSENLIWLHHSKFLAK